MGIRGEIFSKRVILERRSYFFNVKENRTGDLYLNIVESKNKDNGGFDRQSIALFSEDLEEFVGGFQAALKFLENAIRDKKKLGRRIPQSGDDPRRERRSYGQDAPGGFSESSGSSGKPDRFNRSDRNDRSERYNRSDRPDRFDQSERSERSDRGERSERSDRYNRGERSERSDRYNQGERSDRSGSFDRVDRSERTERPERYDRSDRSERPDRFDRSERPVRPDRPARFERSDRPGKPDRPGSARKSYFKSSSGGKKGKDRGGPNPKPRRLVVKKKPRD